MIFPCIILHISLNHFTFKSHCFWYLVSAMACSLSSSFLLVSRIRCSTGLLLVGLAFCYIVKTWRIKPFLVHKELLSLQGNFLLHVVYILDFSNDKTAV